MVWTGTSSNQTNRATSGVLANDNSGRAPREFKTTIVWAAETNPVAPCFYVPAGFTASSYSVNTEALSSSAGVGLVADFGDAGDPDRLAAALDLDAAGFNQGLRIGDALGTGYTYTERTLINLTVTGVPLVGTKTVVRLTGTML